MCLHWDASHCRRSSPTQWLLKHSTRSPPAGSLIAPLTSTEDLPEGLPPVTMVFSSVEGGKQYSAWHRQDAREVHLQLLAVMYSVLRQVPGGYFVRHQDGELKYIIVFSKPEASIVSPPVSLGSLFFRTAGLPC